MPFPPSFTNVWDTTFPPDTQAANQLGLDLRNFRTDVMQRMSLLSGTFANRPTPEIANAVWGGAGFGLLYFSTDTSQVFQWSGAVWTDITSSILGIASGGAQGGSRIVATVNLTAQAAAIGNTTLYAVPIGNPGIYRETSDLIVTTIGTGGTFNDVVQWNNGVVTVAVPGGAIAAGNLGSESGQPNVRSFYSAGGQNIVYSVTFTGVTGPLQYSFRARLEYLG